MHAGPIPAAVFPVRDNIKYGGIRVMRRNILKTALIIAATAVIVAATTSVFMIYTAKPSTPCDINWCGFVHSYK